jgi:hypothetical protein
VRGRGSRPRRPGSAVAQCRGWGSEGGTARVAGGLGAGPPSPPLRWPARDEAPPSPHEERLDRPPHAAGTGRAGERGSMLGLFPAVAGGARCWPRESRRAPPRRAPQSPLLWRPRLSREWPLRWPTPPAGPCHAGRAGPPGSPCPAGLELGPWRAPPPGDCRRPPAVGALTRRGVGRSWECSPMGCSLPTAHAGACLPQQHSQPPRSPVLHNAPRSP